MAEVDQKYWESTPEQERHTVVLRVAAETFDILFYSAPVMMHSIDGEGRLIMVNRPWLQKMGYEKDEVLGRRSTEFLTEESRQRALKDTLPLFWRVGSARSIGYQFVRKNGQIIDVLLDPELVRDNSGNTFTIAALSEEHDPTQWEQATTVIQALKELTTARDMLLGTLPTGGSYSSDAGLLALQDSFGNASAVAGETLGTFLEHTENISVNLRALLRVHEEMLDASVEQKRDLLNVAKNIERSLAYLADMAADRQKSE